MKIIPTWVYAAVIAALVALIGVQTVRVAGLKTDIAELKQDHADVLSDQSEQRARDEKAARDKEAALRAGADKLAKEKQDEIDTINTRLGDALERLRQREARPAAVASGASTPAAACKGADGSGLYAEDGEFLIREASRADKLRAALMQCYQQYDAAAGVVAVTKKSQ